MNAPADPAPPEPEVVSFGISDLSDVTFVLGNKEFNAHKMILANASDYFEYLLFGDPFSPESDRITLRFDPVAFERVLKFIYEWDFGTDEIYLCDCSKYVDPADDEHFIRAGYTLYSLLDLFGLRRAKDHFWRLVGDEECDLKDYKDGEARDCGHCLNGPLLSIIHNEEHWDDKYTEGALQTWMEIYYPIMPQLVNYDAEAMLRRIKEFVI